MLAREKETIHLCNAINAERQALSWVKVDAAYVFESPEGKGTLLNLFDGRNQLMVHHFMLGSDWDAGCSGCSSLSDHTDGILPHSNHHDVISVAVSCASMDKIVTYKERVDRRLAQMLSFGSTFNHDCRMSFSQDRLAGGSIDHNYAATLREEIHDEPSGMSAFYKDETRSVFYTYSTYACGLEDIVGMLLLLNRASLSRNENGPMLWVRRHDEYEDAPSTHGCSTT